MELQSVRTRHKGRLVYLCAPTKIYIMLGTEFGGLLRHSSMEVLLCKNAQDGIPSSSTTITIDHPSPVGSGWYSTHQRYNKIRTVKQNQDKNSVFNITRWLLFHFGWTVDLKDRKPLLLTPRGLVEYLFYIACATVLTPKGMNANRQGIPPG